MTILDPKEAIIFAVYPFILVGAPIASGLSGWTAWKLRRIPVALWWFLVAISLLSAAVWVDCAWYTLYRLQSDGLIWVGWWADRTNRDTFPIHASIRIFIAIPTWIFILTSLAVLKGKSQVFGWTAKVLRKALTVGVVVYALLTVLIYSLMVR